MTNSKAQKLFEQVALKNGVSVAEVRKEIEIAIDEAMTNPDPAVKKEWENFKFKGDKPTPEEFIVHMAKKVQSPKPSRKFNLPS